MKYALTILGGLALSGTAALADGHASGDAAAGESIFRQCASCHVIANGDEVLAGRGKTGPNLYGLFGRQAGTVEGFDYGDSIVAAGQAGLEWNEEDFLAYVEDPRSFLQTYLDDKGARSKMSFRLRKGGEDVWAYIVSMGPEVTN
ncbi:c-type cytochrome [Oceanibium sediminis]|uniref:c-type cytochrome n=1 Tax=Oceanibium sediminis TaxID=2026339 RepID=UPI000DD38CB1|nr:c-type cytochrome [Oceanibium sediminis]